jgi:hypothetical protein
LPNQSKELQLLCAWLKHFLQHQSSVTIHQIICGWNVEQIKHVKLLIDFIRWNSPSPYFERCFTQRNSIVMAICSANIHLEQAKILASGSKCDIYILLFYSVTFDIIGFYNLFRVIKLCLSLTRCKFRNKIEVRKEILEYFFEKL